MHQRNQGIHSVMVSSVPLLYHDPDRSWVIDPDPDHPKGTHPKLPPGSSAIIFKFLT